MSFDGKKEENKNDQIQFNVSCCKFIDEFSSDKELSTSCKKHLSECNDCKNIYETLNYCKSNFKSFLTKEENLYISSIESRIIGTLQDNGGISLAKNFSIYNLIKSTLLLLVVVSILGVLYFLTKQTLFMTQISSNTDVHSNLIDNKAKPANQNNEYIIKEFKIGNAYVKIYKKSLDNYIYSPTQNKYIIKINESEKIFIKHELNKNNYLVIISNKNESLISILFTDSNTCILESNKGNFYVANLKSDQVNHLLIDEKEKSNLNYFTLDVGSWPIKIDLYTLDFINIGSFTSNDSLQIEIPSRDGEAIEKK